jgi:hypothetical protein
MFVAAQDLLYEPASEASPGVTLLMRRTSLKQKWFLLCAPPVTIIPGIFLMLRSYTKVTVLRNVDLTDCKYLTIPLSCFNLLHGADFVIVAFASTMSPHLSYEVLTTAVDLRRELGYGKTDHVPWRRFPSLEPTIVQLYAATLCHSPPQPYIKFVHTNSLH